MFSRITPTTEKSRPGYDDDDDDDGDGDDDYDDNNDNFKKQSLYN